MGAWIEISLAQGITYSLKYVTPFMGAWIEIFTTVELWSLARSRTLYGCVD